jgi:hypothetical protein
MRTNKKPTRRNLGQVPANEHDLVSGRKRSPGRAARRNEATITKAFAGARSEIRAHARAIRAEREQAHEDRMANCTEAAMSLPAEKIIEAATVDPRPIVKGKTKRLALTSRAKMGAARKSRKKAEPKPDTLAQLRASVEQLDPTAVTEAKTDLAVTTDAAEKVQLDWSTLPEYISREGANIIAKMLIEGEATSRDLIAATGMADTKDRIKVDKAGERNGYRLRGRANPNTDPADRAMTHKLWRWEKVSA